MSKRRYSDRDYNDLQKLKHENQKLKRQVSSLRKQLARIDIDRYDNLKELLEKHDQEDIQQRLADERERHKKQWECFECKNGILKLITLTRQDGMFYFRKCDNTSCRNRTKTKKWTKDVEGIE